MIPLTVNPTVVIQVNDEGDILNVASNVAPDLKVEMVFTDASFRELASNKPFDTTRPVVAEQVFAAKKKS